MSVCARIFVKKKTKKNAKPTKTQAKLTLNDPEML